MNKTQAEGNVTTEGKTPFDFDKVIADNMADWETDDMFAENAVAEEDQEAVSDDDGETAEGAEDSAEQQAESDENAEDDGDMSEDEEKDSETAPEYTDGIAGALRYLNDNEKQFPPDVLKALKGLQGEYTRLSSERSTKEKDLDEKLSKVETLIAQLEEPQDDSEEQEQADPNDPLNKISPQHFEIFEKMAEKLGYVKESTLTQKEQAKHQTEYISEADKMALDEFGELYGKVSDDGKVELSQDAVKIIQSEYERLKDSARGATKRDFLILGHYPELIKKAQEKAVAAYKAEQAKRNKDRVDVRKKATTITSSRPSSNSVPKINVKKNDPNRFDKVMNQAFAIGLAQASKVV